MGDRDCGVEGAWGEGVHKRFSNSPRPVENFISFPQPQWLKNENYLWEIVRSQLGGPAYMGNTTYTPSPPGGYEEAPRDVLKNPTTTPCWACARGHLNTQNPLLHSPCWVHLPTIPQGVKPNI